MQQNDRAEYRDAGTHIEYWPDGAPSEPPRGAALMTRIRPVTTPVKAYRPGEPGYDELPTHRIPPKPKQAGDDGYLAWQPPREVAKYRSTRRAKRGSGHNE